MRVRVIKDFAAAGRTFRAGEVVEINPRTESNLLSTGLVMQDKSLDGGKEAKVEIPRGRLEPPKPWPRKGKRLKK